LPASIAEELADGLTETYRFHRSRGLAPSAPAEAAVAEFGPAEEIAASAARIGVTACTLRPVLAR
jgi:hypothetical protein